MRLGRCVWLVLLVLPQVARANPALTPVASTSSRAEGGDDPLRADLLRARDGLESERERFRYHIPATLMALGVASLAFGFFYPLEAEGRVGPILVGSLLAGGGAGLAAYTYYQKSALQERIEELDRRIERLSEAPRRGARPVALRLAWRF